MLYTTGCFGRVHISMVSDNKLKAGFCSDTERAKAVKERFALAVNPDELSINDTPPEQRADGRGVVSVKEGKEAELSGDDFGRFMELAHKLQNRHKTARWVTDEKRCLVLGYDAVDDMTYSDTPAGRAGEDLADPKTMSEDTESERFGVLHGNNGNGEYHVHDRENDAVYVVSLEGLGTSVKSVFGQEDGPDGDLKRAIVGSIIDQMPVYREAPDHYVNLEVNQSGGAGGAGSSSGDGSGGGSGDSEDIEVVQDLPDDNDLDNDPEVLEDAVSNWLSRNASVRSGMIDGAWHVECANMVNPDSGDGEIGVWIRYDPWDGPLWDSSNSRFDTDDGKMPDEWKEHTDAMRTLLSDDNEPTKGIPVDNEDTGYTDWYNYVPAHKVSEITE